MYMRLNLHELRIRCKAFFVWLSFGGYNPIDNTNWWGIECWWSPIKAEPGMIPFKHAFKRNWACVTDQLLEEGFVSERERTFDPRKWSWSLKTFRLGLLRFQFVREVNDQGTWFGFQMDECIHVQMHKEQPICTWKRVFGFGVPVRRFFKEQLLWLTLAK